jgi:hypothetical protein
MSRGHPHSFGTFGPTFEEAIYGSFPRLGSASPGDHATSDGSSAALFSSNELAFRYASTGSASLLEHLGGKIDVASGRYDRSEGGRQRGS